MRCDQCNKFVPFDEGEPEVESLEVSDDGQVSASVRIVNNCAECSQELTEATFDMEADHSEECKDHQGDGHELEIEEDGSDRTGKSGYFKKGKWVSAGGRYAKTFYGATVDYTITCSCGKLGEDGKGISGQLADDVQASGMDSLI